MNSVTAQRPLHHTVGYDSMAPFPLFRIRPQHPSLPILGLCARDFFFRNGRLGFGRVSPLREKLTEFTAVLPTLCGNSKLPFRLGHSFGLETVYHFAFTLRRPKRNMSEAPIRGVLAPPTVRAPEFPAI